MTVDGGGRVEGLNLLTNRRNLCTTAFVVANGETTAITTAAHCPDNLTYVDRDGSTIDLPMIAPALRASGSGSFVRNGNSH